MSAVAVLGVVDLDPRVTADAQVTRNVATDSVAITSGLVEKSWLEPAATQRCRRRKGR
jgi:hypothetical protein